MAPAEIVFGFSESPSMSKILVEWFDFAGNSPVTFYPYNRGE